MSTDLRAALTLVPPLVPSVPTIALEPVGFATCPLCHTADPTMTNAAIGAGSQWQCARCGQLWDSARLRTVAAYAVWVAGRVT